MSLPTVQAKNNALRSIKYFFAASDNHFYRYKYMWMMLTQEEILLVKKTWRIFRAIDPAVVGGTFYAKLFIAHPGLRRLFPKDMEPQYVKLMDMLNAVVSRLDRLHEISEEIAAMTERHVSYGVKPEHYAMVGDALLWTIEKGLGKDWTPSVKHAWTRAYNLLADRMVALSV
jgi:hemoglobin-like flavoprotein